MIDDLFTEPAIGPERFTGIYDSAGCWCAYVEAGSTVDERRARLADCPERFRAAVEGHVRMVFALKARVRR